MTKTNSPFSLTTAQATKAIKHGGIVQIKSWKYYYKYDKTTNATYWADKLPFRWNLYSIGCTLMEEEKYAIMPLYSFKGCTSIPSRFSKEVAKFIKTCLIGRITDEEWTLHCIRSFNGDPKRIPKQKQLIKEFRDALKTLKAHTK